MINALLTTRELDSTPVRLVRRRIQLWCVLNIAVVALPLSLRALVWLFFHDQNHVRVWNLEEVFFFSMFVVSSALADIYEHCKNEGRDLTLPVDRYFTGLVGLALIMATTYGLAFSGVATMTWAQYLYMAVIVVAGVGFAFRAQLQLLQETILRTSS